MKYKIWNTKKRGVFEFLIYPESNRFIGICLTLNIIEEGKDPRRLLESLIEAAFGHLETVRKDRLSDELLNRPAPKKYWDKYYATEFLKEVQKILQRRTVSTPITLKQEVVY